MFTPNGTCTNSAVISTGMHRVEIVEVDAEYTWVRFADGTENGFPNAEIIADPTKIVKGAWDDEEIEVRYTTGGDVIITARAFEYGESVGNARVQLDHDGRQALIRALEGF